MKDPIDEIRREAFREVHRDGLTEIATGVMLFVVALATGRPAFYWAYLAAIVILGPGLTKLRARYTYPRIGFAELPAENRRELGRGIVVWVFGSFLLVAMGLALIGRLDDNLAWRRASPLLGALLLAGGLLYLAQRSGLRRVYGLAIASVVSGALLAWPVLDGAYANLRVWALVMSLACLAVGCLALRRFLGEPTTTEWESRVG